MRIHITVFLQKTPPLSNFKIHDLWKAEAETDARRQISQISLYPLPNAVLSYPYEFEG